MRFNFRSFIYSINRKWVHLPLKRRNFGVPPVLQWNSNHTRTRNVFNHFFMLSNAWLFLYQHIELYWSKQFFDILPFPKFSTLPPFVMIETSLLGIDYTRLEQTVGWLASQSSSVIFSNYLILEGARFPTFLFKIPLRFSIRFRSGDICGHCSTLTFRRSKKAVVFSAACLGSFRSPTPSEGLRLQKA